jgi:NAD(P)-dependent dehydrogenase (short-subunit alcohol dehydrogenase family)
MIALDLTGRMALVTGASGGVWSAVAERFAEAGATVVVHRGRDADGARRVAGRLERITVAVVSADLTDKAAVTRLFDPAAPYGPVTALVNCAGVYPSSPMMSLTRQDWASVFAVNVETTFLCLRAAR